MSDLRWCVVVVRGWVDGDDVKIRMLASGNTEAAAVVGSIPSAADQLAVWLSALQDDTPERGPDRGRPGDTGREAPAHDPETPG